MSVEYLAVILTAQFLAAICIVQKWNEILWLLYTVSMIAMMFGDNIRALAS